MNSRADGKYDILKVPADKNPILEVRHMPRFRNYATARVSKATLSELDPRIRTATPEELVKLRTEAKSRLYAQPASTEPIKPPKRFPISLIFRYDPQNMAQHDESGDVFITRSLEGHRTDYSEVASGNVPEQ